MDLLDTFKKINETHFDGFLEVPLLRWNSRLRSSAGRFIPGRRKFFSLCPPVIEVASYLLENERATSLIEDTIAHEMIHYWLWVRRRPYGHTDEFIERMKAMGVSRYNSAPKLRPYRYVYRCPKCEKDFLARRKLGILACSRCCKQFSNGKFDSRFALFLEKALNRREGLELAQKRT